MNIAYRSLTVLSVLLVAAMGTPTHAQSLYPSTHREWEVSGFLGRSSAGKFQFPTRISGTGDPASSRNVGMQFESGNLLGVRIDQNVNENWNATMEYSFAAQPIRFLDLAPEIQNLSLNQYIHHLSSRVGVLPLRPTSRFRPYGQGGLGAAWFYLPGRVKKDALELGLSLRDSFELSYDVGGGFKYLVHDEFAIGVDVKGRISRVPSYGLPPTATMIDGRYVPGVARHGTMTIGQISFGLTYQWDEF